VAGLLYGGADALQWSRKDTAVDFFDAKGDVQALLAPRTPEFRAAIHPAMHPGRCAEVLLDGQPVGYVGELHPRWRQRYELPHAPVLFELDLDTVLDRPVPAYAGVPRQQPVFRDLALVVADTVEHAALMAALRDDPAGLVRSATLFDVYKPAAGAAGFAAGERSLAVRLELLDDSATLTDERIDATVAAAVQRVQQQCGGRLRA
jgi:phenylalanyl-tRNA synthetase beta chain